MWDKEKIQMLSPIFSTTSCSDTIIEMRLVSEPKIPIIEKVKEVHKNDLGNFIKKRMSVKLEYRS